MLSNRIVPLLGFLLAMMLVGSIWLLTAHQPPGSKVLQVRSPPRTKSAPATLSPSAVLSIDVSKRSPPRVAGARPVPVATLSREFDSARNLRALYDRLTGPGAPTTGEAKFVLYRILATCATRPDLRKAAAKEKPLGERRRALADSIPEVNPEKAQRLAAFDALAARCDGFQDVSTTQAQLDGLLADAVRAGSPTARAIQLEHSLFDRAEPSKGTGLTDEQLGSLRDILATRDPDAILIAGTVLSNTFRNGVIEVGPNHDELNGLASLQAWRLLACDYGVECGADNRMLLASCAYSGQCGASSWPDYIYFYEATPNQAQLIERYRQLFRSAMESNDWSQLQFVRRPSANGQHYGFTTYP